MLGFKLMRYVFLLTFALITHAFGVDATLIRESGGYCIYDDGSTIKSLTCPNRLSIGSSKKVIGNGSFLSDERDQWLLDFGKKQADSISSVYVPSLPSPQQIAARKQRVAETARKQRVAESASNTKANETIGHCVLANARKTRLMSWINDYSRTRVEDMIFEIRKRQRLGERRKPETNSEDWTANSNKYKADILKLQDSAQELRNYALKLGKYEDAEHLNAIVSCGGLSL